MAWGGDDFGYGSVFIDEKGVQVREPEKYPAWVGALGYMGRQMLFAIDYVRVESPEDFQKFVKRVQDYFREAFEKELDATVRSSMKEFYGGVDEEDVEVIKAGWQLGIKRYGKGRAVAGITGYEEWPGYSGLTKEKSLRINDWLWDQAFEQATLDLEKLVMGLEGRFGLDRQQAENIVRTEMANIFNKMREWAYTTETRVRKFKWVAKADSCEKCREVAERTAGGVTLDELKAIIKEVGGEYAREWTVHPQCRCTFKRAYGKGRGWERV